MENQMIKCEACGMDTPKMKLCSFCGEPLDEGMANTETVPMPKVEATSGVNEILKDAQVMAAIDAVRSGTYGGTVQTAEQEHFKEPKESPEEPPAQAETLSEDALETIADAVAAKLANSPQEITQADDKAAQHVGVVEQAAPETLSLVEEQEQIEQMEQTAMPELLAEEDGNGLPENESTASQDSFVEDVKDDIEEPIYTTDAPTEPPAPIQASETIQPIMAEPSLEIAIPVPTRKLFFSDESEQLLYMAVLGYMYYTLPLEIQNMDTMLKILTECNNHERLAQLIKDYKVSIVTRYGNENVARNTDEWFVVRQFEKYQSNVAVR